MGKKKGKISKQMKPYIEKAFKENLVYVRTMPKSSQISKNLERYEVSIGEDIRWYETGQRPGVVVFLDLDVNTGKFELNGVNARNHMSRQVISWLENELTDYIVFHRMIGDTENNFSIKEKKEIEKWDQMSVFFDNRNWRKKVKGKNSNARFKLK